MRLAYDLPPMGFLNPFLYQTAASHPEAFNDIVTGNIACGNIGSTFASTKCCEYSFAAAPGWDATTGLGSPNFFVISNLVLNSVTDFPNNGAYIVNPETYVTGMSV